MKFWQHYLQVLLPLLAAFAVYHAVAVPRLAPIPKDTTSKWVSHQASSHAGTPWWESFFVEGSWQRQSPLMIERDQCILLYQEREQITDKRWRFKPLTIVIPQNSANGNRRAIFIENPKGAEIQFKSAFDWTSGQPPPVVNGQLIGDIKIYSPADESNPSGELLIETQDMRIDKRQIWTDKQIKMKLGDSYVEGRYLSIFMDQDLLAENTASTVPAAESPFHGLDYLQLFYVDRVHMALQPGGLWPKQGDSDAPKRSAFAKLDCRGRFMFQFHQSQATFLDGVHMEHHVQGLPVDTFDCNELKLNVGWPDSENRAVAERDTKNQWKLNRLEATGLPGRDANDQSRWLKLLAPGMQAEAHGQHLVMDFVNGMVSLSNSLPGTAPRNSSRVFLKRESLQVSSPQVQYQNPELIQSNGQRNLRRLGWVLADGIGVAQFESNEEIWVLKWSKRLVVRPHEHRDLIQIDGGANISSSQRGRFIAEHMDMWVLPVDESLAQRLKPYYAEETLPSFVPDAMQATGDVTVNTPELNAQVESMAIRFHYPDAFDPSLDPKLRPTEPTPGPRPQPSTETSTLTQPPLALIPPSPRLSPPADLRTPANNLAQPSVSSGVPPRTNPSDPIAVTGKTLDAEVIRLGAQTIVDSMTLEGNFTLTRDRFSEESPWPMKATGDRLVLQNESKDISNIHLQGQPAKIEIGSGWVIAQELQLSQNDQMFWIDHPGELVIPIEALEQQTASNASNASTIPNLLNSGTPRRNDPIATSGGIRWQSAPRVQWRERMTFDGRIARFGGGVSLDARMQSDPQTLWHILANAQTMTLDLASRVPMRLQPRVGPGAAPKDASATKAELSILRLDGDVDVKAAQTDLQGNRVSTENLQVPRLEFHVPNRTLIGFGPGQLWSRRHGNNGALELPGVATKTTAANAPPRAAKSESLQCLHLTFLGRMEGTLDQRLVSFFDKIDALLGPIVDWNDAIDVRKAETLGPNQTRLVCDQLNLFDASGLSYNQTRRDNPKSAWELDALGNSQLATRTDSGDVVVDAARIVYAAAEDAVRIEGTTRRAATIRRLPQGATADRIEEIHVSSAAMRLKTGQLDAQIRKIEGVLPQQFQPPGPNGNPPPGANPNAAPSATTPAPGTLPSARDFNPLQPRQGRK